MLYESYVYIHEIQAKFQLRKCLHMQIGATPRNGIYVVKVLLCDIIDNHASRMKQNELIYPYST